MLNKNNMGTGVLLGLILPVISGVLFELLFKNVVLMGKRGIPYLIVIALNLIMMRYFGRKHQDKTVMGIMLVTFVFMLFVFIFRFNKA
jgi:predicted Na+-dependent transporter